MIHELDILKIEHDLLKTARQWDGVGNGNHAAEDRNYVSGVMDVIVAVLELLKERAETEINVFDEEEIYHNCTVQVLRNSMTGMESVGWWQKGDFDDYEAETD